ncbi:MAG: hypothetical protein RI952_1273 [Bacteroidota bacterium]
MNKTMLMPRRPIISGSVGIDKLEPPNWYSKEIGSAAIKK